MIPLVSIGKLIATLLAIYVTFYSYKSWKTTQDKISKYTFKLFLCLVFVFGSFILPPFIKDLFIIQLIFYLVEFLSLISITYLFLIFLESMGWQEIKKFVSPIFFLLAVILLIIYSFHFNQAQSYNFQFFNLQFVGWTANLPYLSRIISFSLITAFTVFCSILLLNKIYKIENVIVKKRGLWFVLGLFGLAVSGGAYFVYGSIQPTSFFKDLIHVVAGIMVPLCFLKVITYRKNK